MTFVWSTVLANDYVKQKLTQKPVITTLAQYEGVDFVY